MTDGVGITQPRPLQPGRCSLGKIHSDRRPDHRADSDGRARRVASNPGSNRQLSAAVAKMAGSTFRWRLPERRHGNSEAPTAAAPSPTILDCARADDLVGCTSPPYGRQPDTQPSLLFDTARPAHRAVARRALNRTPAPVKPATPRRRPTRPVAATVGAAPFAPASLKA
jgi:hypothetical protein